MAFTQGVLTSLVESVIVFGENFSHIVFSCTLFSQKFPQLDRILLHCACKDLQYVSAQGCKSYQFLHIYYFFQ